MEGNPEACQPVCFGPCHLSSPDLTFDDEHFRPWEISGSNHFLSPQSTLDLQSARTTCV